MKGHRNLKRTTLRAFESLEDRRMMAQVPEFIAAGTLCGFSTFERQGQPEVAFFTLGNFFCNGLEGDFSSDVTVRSALEDAVIYQTGSARQYETWILPHDETVPLPFGQHLGVSPKYGEFHLVLDDGSLLFTGETDGTPRLWRTNGSPAGTTVFSELEWQIEGVDEEGNPTTFVADWHYNFQRVGDRLIYSVSYSPFFSPERMYSIDAGIPNPNRPPLQGDLDRDGEVNFADFLILSQHYGQKDATAEEGDINEDDIVDFSDFLLLSANFGSSTLR